MSHAQRYFARVYLAAASALVGKVPESKSSAACCACCWEPVSNPLHCSACQGVRYCGRSCQKCAWKGQSVNGKGGYYLQRHKDECTEIKGFMTEMADVQAILKQFPWAIVDMDGGFDYHIALALRSLLGEGPEFGWWPEPLPRADLDMKELSAVGHDALFLDTHGSALLSDKHFDERSGWKLPAEEVPWLTFDEGRKPPSFPPVFEHNWTSYYKWRGLPLKSPAALLLHWPLSIYRLLSLLCLVPSEFGGSKRHKLNIHLIGVGAELNCLPIFGELALLLPNTDIDMVMFGGSAHNVARQAKPSAIASRKYAYEFRAPEQCGSGSIRIQLHKESAIWDPIDILSHKLIPDALVGLDAGISTFVTWRPVFSTSRALSIPFAVTEYTRVSLAVDRHNFETFIEEARADIRLSGLLGQAKMQVLAKSLDQQPSEAINPFMRPGNLAAITNRLPNAVNGFSCIVTPRPETK